jgi:hypothetical protein
MPMLTPMTELDAVNDMLAAIGQAPVSTLSVSGLQDVNIARSLLTRVLRGVLTRGWWFNTDAAREITPDLDGHLVVPSGVLKIDPKEKYTGIVARTHPTKGRILWNTADQTWMFTEPLEATVVWGFPFDELPESAKSYVAIAAGRKFQAQTIGSSALDGYAKDDEERAWADLVREDRASRDTNLLRTNPALARSSSIRSY